MAVWVQSDGTLSNVWASRYTPSAGWGTATLIETDNAGNAAAPQIALDGSGNAVAVWTQSDGSRDNVWANRYTLGTGWGTAALIETDNLGSASEVKLAVNAAGQAQAVWAQSDGSRTNIWANRFVPPTGWGTATLLETDNLGAANAPQIAVDSNGNAVALWQQSDGTRTNIWVNRFVQGAWGGAQLIENNNAGNASAPQLAVDTNGNAVAVWKQANGVPGLGIGFDRSAAIWANRFTPGSGWGSAATIEPETAGESNDPQIAMDASGNVQAVWQRTIFGMVTINATTTTEANRYTAGTGWGTSQQLAVSMFNARFATNAQGKEPVLIWSDTNNFWSLRYTPSTGWGSRTLVFDDFRSGSPGPSLNQLAMTFDATGNAVAVFARLDGLQGNLWANTFNANPKPPEPTPAPGVKAWRTPSLIEADSGDARDLRLASDGKGNLVAVWQSEPGMGNSSRILANRYTPSAGWGTATTISLGGGLKPQVVMDTSGNAVAGWVTGSGSTRSDLWLNRYSAGAWETPTQIPTTGDAFDLKLAVQANGSAIALWTQNSPRNNLWASRYTPGAGWGAASRLSDSSVDAFGAQVVIDSRGNALAVWAHFGRPNPWFSRSAAGSATWAVAAPIETVTNSQTVFPSALTFDANDNALAIWTGRSTAGSNLFVWATPYTAAAGWGSPASIGTSVDAFAGFQSSIDANGNALAVWSVSTGTTGDGQIFSVAYTAGSGWGTAAPVSNASGFNLRLIKAGTEPLLLWQASRDSCLSSRLKPNTGWSPVAGLFDDFRTGGSTGCPELAFDASGNGVAVWSRIDGVRIDGVQSNVWSNTYR